MPVSLYEHPAWQQTPDQVLRPGGLEITTRALSFCSLPPGARVLDVGCGSGAALGNICAGREWQAYGIDISLILLRQARRNCPGGRFVKAHGERLPFGNEMLDAIIAECTLSILDTDTTLRECERALKPGGFLIANDVYAREESGIEALRKLPAGTCIGSAMSRNQIQQTLDRSGLQVVWWQDCSEKLKEFPVCTLTTAAEIDPFDLYIAAARAKVGYYFLVAQKGNHNNKVFSF